MTLTFGDVDVGITVTVEERSEADSSSECPECGSENVRRDGDGFRCQECELDAHACVAGAWNMLLLQSERGLMARSATLCAGRNRDAHGAYWEWEWDEHEWILSRFEAYSLNQTSISKPASSQLGQPTGWVAHRGIPRVQSWEEVNCPGNRKDKAFQYLNCGYERHSNPPIVKTSGL